MRQLKGTMVRTVERVLEHRRLKGAIELKVKWAHLSEAESLALGWSPLSNFYEIDSEGDRVYNPIVAKYLDEKDIDTDDEA